jgi:hypothetical protein
MWGVLSALQYRMFYLPVSSLKTERLQKKVGKEHYHE